MDPGEQLQSLVARSGRSVWLKIGTLLDGSDHDPIQNAHLVYDANGIRYVGSEEPNRDLLSEDQKAPGVELLDHTAMPGLIDAHCHSFLDGAPVDFEVRKQLLADPFETILERAKGRLQKIIECGVLGLRDAGDRLGVGFALREIYQKKQSPAPYIDCAGPVLHHKGKYGKFMGETIEEGNSPAEAVAKRVALGSDRIKILVSGIINFEKGAVTDPPQMTAEEVREFVALASARECQTLAHASGVDGIQNAIDGGVNSLEHGFFMTRDQLSQMRDQRTAWVPTFSPVEVQIDRAKEIGWSDAIVSNLQKIIDLHRDNLRHAHEIGAPVVAGSDAGSMGVPHGLGLLAELERMETAGMPTRSVLHSATGRSDDHLAYLDPIGRIAEGYRSRFVVTAHSPLEAVSNLRKSKWLVLDGEVHSAGPVLSDEGL